MGKRILRLELRSTSNFQVTLRRDGSPVFAFPAQFHADNVTHLTFGLTGTSEFPTAVDVVPAYPQLAVVSFDVACDTEDTPTVSPVIGDPLIIWKDEPGTGSAGHMLKK